jgi:hypothetical protein
MNNQLSNYAKTTDLHSHNNKTVLDGITSTNVTNWGSAYTHSTSSHAPSNAQKNSDITKAEIESKLTGTITSHSHNYLTSVPSEYVTDSELNAKGYLTQHQDLSSYAKKTDIPSVPTKVSQLTNDSGYITSIPSEYITDSELNAKGYLTEHQSLSDYAKKTDIPSIIANSKERITYYGYVGEPPDSWAYFPLIRFAPDDSGNYGNVIISGRIGGWLNDNSATYSITLLNRSNRKDGNTITATVQAMGEVAKALDVADIEIYKQSDNSHIAYFKATFYALWDITYATMQHSIIYDGSSSATVPSGTLIWSLSSCNKTILSTSGTLSQTGTPSKDSDLVNKSYVDNTVSEYVTETELNNKGYLTQHQDLSAYAKKTEIPTVTNDLTNALKSNYDSAYTHSTSTHAPSNAQKNSDITKAEIEAKLTGTITTHTHNYLTSVPSEYVTESELTAKDYATESYVDSKVSELSKEITDLKTKLVDGNGVAY